MEPHAVPQNVTSFEFRLIGDMTLKQFAYLAAGVGIAYVTFVFLASRLSLLAWPVIVISSLLGIAFAFLPISDRPLDYWVGAFLKAVFSPTKRIWIKNKKIYSQNPLFNQRLNLYLSGIAPQPITPTPITSANPTITSPASVPPTPPTPPPSHDSSLPSSEELSQTVELAKKAQSLQTKILEEQKQLDEIKNKADLEQFNGVLNNLQKLVTEAQTIKKQLDTVTGQTDSQTPVQVEVVKPIKPKATQLMLTSFPNIINGVVTDSVNNYLDSVVVVIYNKDGLPVRALKTNKLGQFTGSTPLPNGTYRIELEKEQLTFDVLQVELTGQVIPPIFINAKKLVAA